MKLAIDWKPLSVNKAWKGKHYPTEEYEVFKRAIAYRVRQHTGPLIEGELRVRYVFYVKNYANTDVANLEKTITDMLVKLGYFKDDRYIKEISMIKERAEEDRIEVEILPFE